MHEPGLMHPQHSEETPPQLVPRQQLPGTEQAAANIPQLCAWTALGATRE